MTQSLPDDIIGLHLDRGDDRAMPPATSADAVLHRPADGGEETIALRVAYADGTVISAPYRTERGVLDTMPLASDDFLVMRRHADHARDEGLDAIVRAIQSWIGVEVQTQDDQGRVMRDLRIEDGSLLFEHGDGETFTIPLLAGRLPLRAIWMGDALLGFAHGDDASCPVVDQQALGPITDRLAVISSRLAGEWQVVRDECVRLGSVPPTALKVGEHVKIGFQPVHPLPDDIRAEWMWVELTSVEDGGARLKGTLANEPGYFDIDLNLGDEVEFSNRDIYAVSAATLH